MSFACRRAMAPQPRNATPKGRSAGLGGRVSGLVELGPEEGEERIPAVEAARGGGGEIDQEGQTLRLGEDGRAVGLRIVAEVEGAERVEVEHGQS